MAASREVVAFLEVLRAAPFPERRDALRNGADTDPAFTRELIEAHPWVLMELLGWECLPHHEEALDEALSCRELLWLAPRGGGKSTSLAVIFPTWLSIADPDRWHPSISTDLFSGAPERIGPWNIRIALTSNSFEKAVALHWQAKQILGSTWVRACFGNLQGKRWKDESSETSLRTANLREGTFTALGLGTKVTGGHYDLMVADDFVTEDNARTELQRSRIGDFWRFTLKPTCEPWARVVACGTRYHPKDWYQEVREWEEKGLWGKVLRTPALTWDAEGNPKSYWPAVYTVAKLLDIREQIGPIAFATQYQNEVNLMGGSFFLPSYLERFESWAELPRSAVLHAKTVVALDPAIKGGQKNDWSVFAVVSWVKPDFWIRHIERGKWTQEELIQRATRLGREFEPMSVPVEAVQGQEWLIQEMKRRTTLPVRGMNPRIGKVPRADRVRSFFETGHVVFEKPAQANGIGYAIEELLGFPDGEHDDAVDAIVWGMIRLLQGGGRLVNTTRGN